MNRIFDPMKYTTLAGILNPEKLANSKTLAQGVREAATGGVSKSLQGVQKTAGGIDSTIKFLVAKASDPTLDRGLRALYILIIKELMFPTQTD